MKMNIKKIIAGTLTAVMTLTAGFMPDKLDLSDVVETEVTAEAYGYASIEPCTDTSGTFGEGLTWKLTDDGVLTISGNGKMTDYDNTTYDNITLCGSPFSFRTDIKSVILENGVTSIGESIFYQCRSLTSIEIPDSVTYIRIDAFYECSSLTSIEIPDSVTSIGANAFYGCGSLESVKIGKGVTSIYYEVFYGCSSLINIELCDGITSISPDAFSGTPLLDNQKSTVKYIDRYLVSCDEYVENIKIKEDTRGITDNGFYSCKLLTSIEIPDRVNT